MTRREVQLCHVFAHRGFRAAPGTGFALVGETIELPTAHERKKPLDDVPPVCASTQCI
jgi:hypothetical protein